MMISQNRATNYLCFIPVSALTDRLHYTFHLSPFLFHIFHQPELGTAAIQIMLLPGNLKISVAGQIVRKEPDSAFQGHEPGSLRKHLNLCFGKASRATLQKSSGIDFKERNGQGWVIRWEQSIQRSLLSKDEKAVYFVKFNLEGLLRGDYQSRMNGDRKSTRLNSSHRL